MGGYRRCGIVRFLLARADIRATLSFVATKKTSSKTRAFDPVLVCIPGDEERNLPSTYTVIDRSSRRELAGPGTEEEMVAVITHFHGSPAKSPAKASNGYVPCGCRDCFEVAIGAPGALCLSCKEAGCDGGECQAPGAYGSEDEA